MEIDSLGKFSSMCTLFAEQLRKDKLLKSLNPGIEKS